MRMDQLHGRLPNSIIRVKVLVYVYYIVMLD